MMDQLEERSLLLKQHLREAELEVARKRAELESMDEERRLAKEEGQRLEEQVARLDQDVELALGGDDPELARFAVRRLLPKREALRSLFTRAAQLEERRARLAEKLEAQDGQLLELRDRVRAALARPLSESVAFDEAASVSEEEIELELLRRRGADGPARTLAGEADRCA
jgi:phage shock protein A